MKKTITVKTLFIYLALIVALIFAYSKTNAQSAAWKPNPKYIKTHTDSAHHAKQWQCQGTTRTGKQCQRKGATAGYYCYQHVNQK